MMPFLATKKLRWLLLFLWLLCHQGLALAGQGPLYRFSKPGQAAHYLLGTMHSDDPRVLAVLQRLDQPFEQVQQVALEILPDTGTMLMASTAMLLPPDQTLSGLLGEKLFRKVVAAMGEKGVPELLLQRMKPWAVAVILGTPELTGEAMDQVIYRHALARHKKLRALETPAEQLALFDQLPERLQRRMLEETLEQRQALHQQLEQLVQVYLDGDLERLQELSLEFDASGDPELTAWFRDHLIRQRNHRMLKRLLPLLQEGTTLVAVGALHLPGNEGLIKLLQRAGYRVEPVL